MNGDGEGNVKDEQYELARGALRAYQRCDYGTAIKRFTQILVEGSEFRPKLLVKRAECFYKIERFSEALKDIDCVLSVDPEDVLARHLKGRVLFACHRVEEARRVFVELEKHLDNEPDHLGLRQLILFCDDKLKRIGDEEKRKAEADLEAARRKEEEDREPAAGMATANPVPSVPQPPAKIRHEWYQTDQAVIVSILVKGLSKDRVSVDSAPQKLTVQITFTEEEKRTVALDLFHPVIAEDTTFKVTPSKIEVSLKKTEAVRWNTLEAPPVEKVETKEPPRPAYPTSAKQQHNWDKLEQEVKQEEAEEKLEGDAALQKVFADIYAGASDDVKKAMTKSYLESGGTVLSTNWDEIKQQKVEVRPPDGMEFKKW